MDKLELYHELFRIFTNGKNSFGIKELGQVMQSYGMKASELELQEMMSSLDTNASGECEFPEFVNFMSRKIKRQEAEEELLEAFRIFDVEGKDFIWARDLREAMNKLGERLSHAEITEMLKEINMEYDGEINIEEAISILTTSSKRSFFTRKL